MNDLTIASTPNPDCPNCIRNQWHTDIMFQTFHPMAGQGFTPEQGWTHLALLPAGVSMKHAAPASGSTPVEKTLVMHSEDGGQIVCRVPYGFWAKERLSVTCVKCLEILNR
jgi:hypothetical protein